MFRRSLMICALVTALGATSATDAEPLQASASARAVASGESFRLSASSGYAVIGASRRQAQLVLQVESLDVLRGESRVSRQPRPHMVATARSTLGSLASLSTTASADEPLLTLFDHVEQRYPESPPEQVTVGLDYRFVDDEEMAFEMAEAGAMATTYASHKVMLTARFSF